MPSLCSTHSCPFEEEEILAPISDNSAKSEVDEFIEVQEKPSKASTPLKGAENSEETDEKAMDIIVQKPKGRQRRPCPIPECKCALHINMWNHIFQTHKNQGKYTSQLGLGLELAQTETNFVLQTSMFYTHLNYLSAVEELKRFMEVAKLQNPTRRSKEKPQPKVNSKTVKQEDDGTVSIKKMEIRPSSK